jgi:DNA phosphorothioation-associated putative methyltransferase
MSFTGKRVRQDLYVHLDAAEALLDDAKRATVRRALSRVTEGAIRPNVLKMDTQGDRISLLLYPEFETSPFPELAASWTLRPDGSLAFRSFQDSLNPPILHRKELLVPEDWPQRPAWSELTRLAESAGLFDDPASIGFRMNWERLVASKGYQVEGGTLRPIGNEGVDPARDVVERADQILPGEGIQRHLTALPRASLSAPIQLLLRSGLLAPGTSVFDYGCGRGTDVSGLLSAGFQAAGWDPHYALSNERIAADIVNLGFVVNVIEDPAERVNTIQAAASLAKRVLAVSVMLSNNQSAGTPYLDGYVTSRKTFQKYFSQDELRDYIEHVLGGAPVMAAPGIALHFADKEWEERYLSSRYERRDLSRRMLDSVASRISIGTAKGRLAEPRASRDALVEAHKPLLDRLWSVTLDLGRRAEPNEVAFLEAVNVAFGSLGRAQVLLAKHYDQSLLERTSRARKDDVLLYVASQLFKKRQAFGVLDAKVRRDIKAFFGDYRAAQASAASLLLETGKPEQILAACREAAAGGIGYLDHERSLQFHLSLVNSLPAVLRAYVMCGLLMWDQTSDVQLIKVHVGSGKLTLLEFEDFETSPLPLLRRRVKVNLRRLSYEVFEYGSPEFPKSCLYYKSRYMNEEDPLYPAQVEFDEALEALGVLAVSEHGLNREALTVFLELRRKQIVGMRLCPSERIPDLDQACGQHFVFRDFVECGEAQRATQLPNVPLNPATYNALHQLAADVLDPVIEYFGGIKLTYGFSSPALSRHINARVAPKLDQHASCEHRKNGDYVCERLGAACDFLVENENMREVAEWILDKLPVDRLYFYGEDRPLHVSVGPQNKREAYAMVRRTSGHVVPAKFEATARGA